jgi:hypothetical protein
MLCQGSFTATVLPPANPGLRPSRRQPVAHTGEHVGVGVEGYGDGGVSEHLGDDLGVDVPRQQERGAGVPQVVEAGVGGEPGALEEPGERAFAGLRERIEESKGEVRSPIRLTLRHGAPVADRLPEQAGLLGHLRKANRSGSYRVRWHL